MAEIKPAEVSAILREQLSGYTDETQLEEIGTVLQIGDGIARIYGLNNVQSGELIEFTENVNKMLLKFGFSEIYGARPLKREIEKRIENPIAKMLINKELRKNKKLIVDAKGGKIFISD